MALKQLETASDGRNQLTTSSSSTHDLLITAPLNKYGWTALHAACYFGHIDIVEYLV